MLRAKTVVALLVLAAGCAGKPGGPPERAGAASPPSGGAGGDGDAAGSASGSGGGATGGGSGGSGAAAPSTSTDEPRPGGLAVPAPAPAAGKKLLTVAEARRYMLALINRDRATEHLPPVELDEGPAQAAGQLHAEDMVKHGYLGHWGTDGSVPEQRYTESGGADFVQENALCFTDEKPRQVDPRPMIEPSAIERDEAMFFNEKPPNDGHRKNILKPFHKKVGIGVSQSRATEAELAVPCFSQEFVDPYGTYAPVPKRVKVGSTLHVEGTVNAPATFAGVGLTRIETPKPIPVKELNTRRNYPIPQPYQMYWPPGFKTPIPIAVSGNHFSIDVPVSDGGKAGLYEVSVWGKVPGAADLVMISLRTFRGDN